MTKHTRPTWAEGNTSNDHDHQAKELLELAREFGTLGLHRDAGSLRLVANLIATCDIGHPCGCSGKHELWMTAGRASLSAQRRNLGLASA